MSFENVVALIGGVALFLFGMGLMGDSLKRLSGNSFAPILFRLSGTPLRGMLLGTAVTAVIQSSCATAVMTVGFVNAKVMKVKQATGIILGAVLGTSVTGWVICLSYLPSGAGLASILSTATLTGVIALAGVVLRMVSKKQRIHDLSDLLMGFAVLMFGLSAMSGAVKGLGSEPWFIEVMTSLSNPVVGILIGAAATALLQSASAAVGIVQALSVTGVMTFDEAFPLLMGIAIGASAPVLMSAIGASADGKRAALIYPMVTVVGVILCASVFYITDAIFDYPFREMTMDPFSMAMVNMLLRIAMTIPLLPFSGLISAAVTAIVRDKKRAGEADPTVRLEERFLTHPALAVEQSRLTINEMADLAEQALLTGIGLFTTWDEERFDEVMRLEETGDRYEDSLGTYLVKVTAQPLTTAENEEVSEYLHTLSDFERLSDHARNLAYSAREVVEKKVHFSDQGKHELAVLTAAVCQMTSMTVTAFRERDLALAARVEPLEELIDDLCDQIKLGHIERLQQGTCTINQGFVFNDIITNCERVSDHCSNIAVAMIELHSDAFRTHSYTHAVREKDSPEFRQAYDEYAARFAI
ncbi:MAG: Na/Pi cotransporter family protein [Clostridia bacterium]|nr:Na/Pi cotransporter family protein [Clostridia bacterium]